MGTETQLGPAQPCSGTRIWEQRAGGGDLQQLLASHQAPKQTQLIHRSSKANEIPHPCHSSPLPYRAHSACTWQGPVHLQNLALPRAKRRVKKSFPLSKLSFLKCFSPASPLRPRWLSGTGDPLALQKHIYFFQPKVLQHPSCQTAPPAESLHPVIFSRFRGKKNFKNHMLLPLVTT